jgi:hypothetical protein
MFSSLNSRGKFGGNFKIKVIKNLESDDDEQI